MAVDGIVGDDMRRYADETLYIDRMDSKASRKKAGLGIDINLMIMPLVMIAAAVCFLIILLPIGSIIRESGLIYIIETLQNPQNISAVKLSLSTTTAAVLLVLILGTPVVIFSA